MRAGVNLPLGQALTKLPCAPVARILAAGEWRSNSSIPARSCCAGRVLNTHQQWLGETLSDAGYILTRQETVPDTAEAICEAVKVARPADLVITGGLGPTSDDITRNGWPGCWPSRFTLTRRSRNTSLHSSPGAPGRCRSLYWCRHKFPRAQSCLPTSTHSTRPGDGGAGKGRWRISAGLVILRAAARRPMVEAQVLPFIQQGCRYCCVSLPDTT